MGITVHPIAQQQWQDPVGCRDLVDFWSSSPDKIAGEKLVGEMVADFRAELGHRLTVADLGCGAGRLVPWISEHCTQYVGYDTAPELLAYARSAYGRSHKCKFVARDVLVGAPTRAPMDLVLSIDTSRHYLQPLDMLEDIVQGWPARGHLLTVLHSPAQIALLNGVSVATLAFQAWLSAREVLRHEEQDVPGIGTLAYVLLRLTC